MCRIIFFFLVSILFVATCSATTDPRGAKTVSGKLDTFQKVFFNSKESLVYIQYIGEEPCEIFFRKNKKQAVYKCRLDPMDKRNSFARYEFDTIVGDMVFLTEVCGTRCMRTFIMSLDGKYKEYSFTQTINYQKDLIAYCVLENGKDYLVVENYKTHVIKRKLYFHDLCKTELAQYFCIEYVFLNDSSITIQTKDNHKKVVFKL